MWYNGFLIINFRIVISTNKKSEIIIISLFKIFNLFVSLSIRREILVIIITFEILTRYKDFPI